MGEVTYSRDADRPDSDFAAVWRDAKGVKQRKLPIYDKAHAMNARARFNQTEMPAKLKKLALKKVEAAERKFEVAAAEERMSEMHNENMPHKEEEK